MPIKEYTPHGNRSDKHEIIIYYFEDNRGHRYDPSSKINHKVDDKGRLLFYIRKEGHRIELKAIYTIIPI